jgi:folate-binding protein YgfZ
MQGMANTNRREYLLAADRGVVALRGPDAQSFLQGLVTNDVTKVSPARAMYAAFLTAQGRFLHDFFVFSLGPDSLHLDCEAARRDDLIRRLKPYRLRSKVEIAPEEGYAVALLLGPAASGAIGLPQETGAAMPFAGGIAFTDPRLGELGGRVVAARADIEPALTAAGLAPAAHSAAYDELRLALGVPDGSRDMAPEKAIPLESNLDELNAVDWNKGCYMGQELTARTKYRGLLRKRLLPVELEGPLPPAGTPVFAGEAEVGEIRSGAGSRALALLRLEALEPSAPALTAGSTRLKPTQPAWARRPTSPA